MHSESGLRVEIDSATVVISDSVAMLLHVGRDMGESLKSCVQQYLKDNEEVKFFSLGSPALTYIIIYRLHENVMVKSSAERYPISIQGDQVRRHIHEMKQIAQGGLAENSQDSASHFLLEQAELHTAVIEAGVYDFPYEAVSGALLRCKDAGMSAIDLVYVRRILTDGNAEVEETLKAHGLVPEIASEEQVDKVLEAVQQCGLDTSVQRAIANLLEANVEVWGAEKNISMSVVSEIRDLLRAAGFSAPVIKKASMLMSSGEYDETSLCP